MIEEQIIQAIANRVEDDRLHFQVIIQEQTLHIYINRSQEADLDYGQLTATVRDAIAELKEMNLSAMELYSRILGEIEPDWQTSVELAVDNSAAENLQSMITEIDHAVSNTQGLIAEVEQELDSNQNPNPDDVAPETTDFSQYCFIRNQGLLTADIVAPKQNIAQLIDTFAKFEFAIKRSQLPLLERYFQNSQKPDISSFEPAIQSWWTEILALDNDAKRKLAIWLSRYCHNPEQTMTAIESVFTMQAAVKKVAEAEAKQKAKEEREARLDFLASSDTSSNSRQNSSNSQKSAKSQPKSKPGCISWISYIAVVAVIRILIKLVFGGFAYDYAAQNEDIAINTEIMTLYSQQELDEAKKLADLGLKKIRKQDLDAAEKYAKQALDIFPEYSRAYYNLGVIAQDTKKYKNAIEYYTDSIEVYPDNLSPTRILHQAYNNRGVTFGELGDYEKAIDDATEAIALAPDDGGYYSNRGLAYAMLRDFDAAIADHTSAIELEPHNAGWYFNRGKAYRKLGQDQQALADLDQAISLNPLFGWAYEQRYYTHLKLGNHGLALQDYQKAKSLGVEPQKGH